MTPVRHPGLWFLVLSAITLLVVGDVQAQKATPGLTTMPSPAPTLPGGGSLSDVANLTGGSNPTGTITFGLDLAGTGLVFTETKSVFGDGQYMSDLFTPGAGTYTWTATYNGDGNNNPVSASNPETVVVPQANPTLTTTPGGTVILGSGARLTDEADLSGGVFPSGSITFMLQDPSNNTVDTETAPVNGNGMYNTPTGYIPLVVGTYDWIVTYSGDSNNKMTPMIAPEAECVASPGAAAPCRGTAPEPSSVALVSLALGGLAFWRRRKLN